MQNKNKVQQHGSHHVVEPCRGLPRSATANAPGLQRLADLASQQWEIGRSRLRQHLLFGRRPPSSVLSSSPNGPSLSNPTVAVFTRTRPFTSLRCPKLRVAVIGQGRRTRDAQRRGVIVSVRLRAPSGGAIASYVCCGWLGYHTEGFWLSVAGQGVTAQMSELCV